jgi:hypothetical protein
LWLQFYTVYTLEQVKQNIEQKKGVNSVHTPNALKEKGVLLRINIPPGGRGGKEK